MAKRNMEQTVKKTVGKIPTVYDISIEEICELTKLYQTDKFNAITTAFRYGFALGARARDNKRVSVL